MQKQPYQFNFHMEHSQLIFSATVGSRLTETNTQNSDTDYIDFYSHKIRVNPFFESVTGEEVVSVDNTQEQMNETCSVLLSNIVSMLLNPKTLQANTFSQLIKHLAAIKFNKVKVLQEDKFSHYYDWLSVPGNGFNFWKQSLNSYDNFWNAMPTEECNWSQKFDEDNSKHIDKKSLWYLCNQGYYPKVDSKLGYDIKYVSWMLTDIILINHILWNNHIIDTDELEFIKSIKEKKVSWKDVKTFKNHVWKNARTSVESPMSSYLLGKGIDIKNAKEKGKYGLTGLVNLLEVLGD